MENLDANIVEEESITVDNATLMNCVQQYRCLYDKRCEDFRILLKKKNAWKEIAAKLITLLNNFSHPEPLLSFFAFLLRRSLM